MLGPAQAVLGGFVLVLAVLAVVLLLLAVRRRALVRRGALDCGYRNVTCPTRWSLGLLVVGPDELRWHRVLSPWRSRRVLRRAEIAVVGQRAPEGGESLLFPPRTTVLQCRDGSDDLLELALPEGGVMGLLAWLEAAPPGGLR